jgi:hypothetical protein
MYQNLVAPFFWINTQISKPYPIALDLYSDIQTIAPTLWNNVWVYNVKNFEAKDEKQISTQYAHTILLFISLIATLNS